MRRLMRAMGMAEYGGDELLLCLLACGSMAYALGSLVDPRLAILPMLPLGIVIWFFRDPNRTGTDEPEAMLSPADGTVSDIEEMDEPTFIGGRAIRIGIFLSPFNVHVNRMPCAGTCRHVKYKTGDFLPAYNPQAPTKNESIALGFETAEGLKMMVKQVTGILARRIICEAAPGDALLRGQRYGMIKFGSRTELYVPVGAMDQVLVKPGDKVVGGNTPLCRIHTQVAPAPVLLGGSGDVLRTPASAPASVEAK